MSATERYLLDLEADLPRAAQELDAAFAGAWAPKLKGHVKASRTFAYFGGPCLQPDGTIEWHVDGTVVCPDNALCLVQRDAITGTVTAPTPAVLASGNRPMAVVRCTSGLLERFVDCRDSVLGAGAQYLDDLLDVSLYDLQDGDVLTYDATLGLWINAPGSALTVEEEGTPEEIGVNRLNFIGSGVTAVGDGVGGVDVTISGGGIDVQDEGVDVVTGATALDFIGDGVEVTDVGGVPTVEVLAVPGPGGGVASFPERPPTSPSAYDEEGDQSALDAKWTEVTTPDASFTRDSDRHGTLLGLIGPGHASNHWDLRQAILNADGDYPTALTVTAKLTISAFNTSIQAYISLSNNTTLATGDFLSFGFYLPAVFGSNFFTVDNGSFAETAMPTLTRTMFFHYQRNTAATSNVRVYISADGIAWTRMFIATKTTNVDYLWVVFGAGTAAQPSALWLDWVRVNDSRFLQPE